MKRLTRNIVRRQSSCLCLGLVVLIGTLAKGQVSSKPEHVASRLVGWKLVEFSDDVLKFDVARTGDAQLVLHSRDPLVVDEVIGGTAKLRPGWDGTIGYSHYALELATQQAGEVVVKLQRITPPNKPQPTTAEDLTLFSSKLKERSSRPPEEAGEFQAWQERHRAKLTAALMVCPLPQRVPLEPRVVETKEFPKFTLRRVEYRSRKDRTSVLLLSIPKGRSSPLRIESPQKTPDSESQATGFPLLLALHGHEAPWGKADEGAYKMGHNDDFMAYFAERGWAVLQPATMDHSLQHKGWTLQGEWTWDAMVALDYAATVPEVDMKRAAVCGLSTGAHLAMNVLALDERVKAGVVGCVLSTWNHYERRCRIPPHCDCGIHGQLSGVLEQCDWAALAVPKPVMFQHGKQDAAFCPGADEKQLDLKWNTGVMPQAEYDTMFAEVKRAYRLVGRAEATETWIHEGPHKVDNDKAFQWLNQWIQSARP